MWKNLGFGRIISAKNSRTRFYRNLGFEKTSDEKENHIGMKKKLATTKN